MPKVDIIIPAYNAAHFLPAAIDSVIAQTSDDWRILLVDDGSTDNTAAVVQPYRDRLGDKLLYIHQENRGLPAARNTAIRNSTAEFLALLDADDVWLPHRLADSLHSFAGRPQVGLSYGANALIDPTGAVTKVFEARQAHAEGRIAKYIYMRMVNLPCPTITFRRAAVDQVGLFDETMRATEDRDLWFRIACHYEVVMVPRVIAHYRTSPQAMTTDPDRMLRAQLQFVAKHAHSPECGPIARRVALSWVYRQHAEALAERNRLGAALRSALRAARFYPFQLSNLRTAGSLLMRNLRSKTSTN